MEQPGPSSKNDTKWPKAPLDGIGVRSITLKLATQGTSIRTAGHTFNTIVVVKELKGTKRVVNLKGNFQTGQMVTAS